MRRESEVVVVAGAGKVLGRAVVRRFAGPGARIGLIGRGREAPGGEAVVVVADIADHGAVDGAAARVEDELGPIDVWVNNAMTTVFAFFEDVEPGELRRATEVT